MRESEGSTIADGTSTRGADPRMHQHSATYALDLVGRRDARHAANVAVTVRDWTDGRRHRACTVRLTWADKHVQATDYHVFGAFRMVRLQLEAQGLRPYCFGACADVRVSGMQIDMGDGTIAYNMQNRDAGGLPDTVNIFHSAPGLTLVSVAEQLASLQSARGRAGAPWWKKAFDWINRPWATNNGADAGVTPDGERADTSRWHACAGCGKKIPMAADRVLDAKGLRQECGTFTYVCPHCGYSHVGTAERWHKDRTAQITCHTCRTELGTAYQCPVCDYPRGWVQLSCRSCGMEQPVDAPHLVVHCDLMRLECVHCGSAHQSACIC